MNQAGTYISVLLRQLNLFFSHELSEVEITASELMYLSQLYTRDGLTQDEMATKISVDKAATTRTIQGMEKKGLIVRDSTFRKAAEADVSPGKRNKRVMEVPIMDMKQAMKERHMVRKYTDKPIPEEIVAKLNERVKKNNEQYGLSIRLITNDGSAVPGIIKLILAKGVNNFFIMAGPEGSDELCGYCGADLMLYAQTLGLKSKKASDVSSYDGKEPEWFKEGVNAALLAPTALDKQAFTITGTENQVSISCDNGIFTGVDTGLVKYHFELGAGKENFEWK